MGTWFTVKVQPEREEKIAGLLEERIRMQGLSDQIREVLIPTIRVMETRGGKQRIGEQKTFPGYLFVEMDLTEESFYCVTETSGIHGFVGSDPKKPEPLPDVEINRILKDIDDKKEKPQLKIEFEVGQQVRIIDGAFQNYEGVVEEVHPGKGLLKVNVHVFGRSTPVELEYYQVEEV